MDNIKKHLLLVLCYVVFAVIIVTIAANLMK